MEAVQKRVEASKPGTGHTMATGAPQKREVLALPTDDESLEDLEAHAAAIQARIQEKADAKRKAEAAAEEAKQAQAAAAEEEARKAELLSAQADAEALTEEARKADQAQADAEARDAQANQGQAAAYGAAMAVDPVADPNATPPGGTAPQPPPPPPRHPPQDVPEGGGADDTIGEEKDERRKMRRVRFARQGETVYPPPAAFSRENDLSTAAAGLPVHEDDVVA